MMKGEPKYVDPMAATLGFDTVPPLLPDGPFRRALERKAALEWAPPSWLAPRRSQ